jgi:T5orf172 domain
MSRSRCQWPMCGVPKWDRIPGMQLCQKHALHVWAQVNTDIEGGEVKPPRPPKPKTPVAGWIYYLKVGDRIKIGYAGDVPQRMRQYPPNAVLFAVHRGTIDDERRIHASLSLHRADGREWYHPTPELHVQLDTILARHPGAAYQAASMSRKKPAPKTTPLPPVQMRSRTRRSRIRRGL